MRWSQPPGPKQAAIVCGVSSWASLLIACLFSAFIAIAAVNSSRDHYREYHSYVMEDLSCQEKLSTAFCGTARDKPLYAGVRQPTTALTGPTLTRAREGILKPSKIAGDLRQKLRTRADDGREDSAASLHRSNHSHRTLQPRMAEQKNLLLALKEGAGSD